LRNGVLECGHVEDLDGGGCSLDEKKKC
jgi:hypothetical protein